MNRGARGSLTVTDRLRPSLATPGVPTCSGQQWGRQRAQSGQSRAELLAPRPGRRQVQGQPPRAAGAPPGHVCNEPCMLC